MDAPTQISPDVIARYAADAAVEVDGVSGLVRDRLRGHRGVRVSEESDGLAVELHLRVAPGVVIPPLGQDVQRRVADYLQRMTGRAPATVDVVVSEIGR